MLFAAGDGTEQVTSETVAKLISDAVTQQVDFPALVERAYGNGARIFVELGPRSACSWWIQDILQDRPHVAVSFNRKSKSDQQGLVLMLAQLVSHGVAVDLSPLYKPVVEETTVKKLVRTVSLCHESIRERVNSAENRALFENITIVESLVEAVAEPVLADELPAKPTFVPPVVEANEKVELSDFMSETRLAVPEAVEKVNGSGKEELPPRRQGAKEEDGFLVKQLEKLTAFSRDAGRAQAEFLRMRGDALEQIVGLVSASEEWRVESREPEEEAVEMTTAESRHAYSRAILPQDENRPNNYTTPDEIVWDQADLIQYAEGSIVPMFGEEYAVIDSYRRRVRLPMYPYLLVDRITKLDAEVHNFRPSTMTTEYDIPFDAWYSTDGQIPWAVSVESGQCDLLLSQLYGH